MYHDAVVGTGTEPLVGKTPSSSARSAPAVDSDDATLLGTAVARIEAAVAKNGCRVSVAM